MKKKITATFVGIIAFATICAVGAYCDNDYAKATVVYTTPTEVVVRLEDGNEYAFYATETTLEENETVTAIFNNAGELTGIK